MSLFLSILISFTLGTNAVPNPDPAPEVVTENNKAPAIALNLKDPLISGETIKIGYQIPYPGYIEFHLFDASGEKIWINSFVQEKGEHYQALKRSKMESGQTYTFDIWYKGKKYQGSFTV